MDEIISQNIISSKGGKHKGEHKGDIFTKLYFNEHMFKSVKSVIFQLNYNFCSMNVSKGITIDITTYYRNQILSKSAEYT